MSFDDIVRNAVRQQVRLQVMSTAIDGPVRDGVYYLIYHVASGRYLTVQDTESSYAGEVPVGFGDSTDAGLAHFRFVTIDQGSNPRRYIINRETGQHLFTNGYEGRPLTSGRQWGRAGYPPFPDPKNRYGDDGLNLKPADGIPKQFIFIIDGGVRAAGQNGLGLRLVRSGDFVGVNGVRPGDPESLFMLQEATRYSPPESKGTTIDMNHDSVLNYIGGIALSKAPEVASALGGKLADLAIPGGSLLTSMVFGAIFPGGNSMSDMLQALRADILNEVNQRDQNSIVKTTARALASLRTLYLVDYVNRRNEFVTGGASFSSVHTQLKTVADDVYRTLSALLPSGLPNDIDVSDENLYRMQAGFPIYVMGAAEHMNMLQETALLDAYERAPNSFTGDIQTLATHASEHMSKIRKMYDYLLNWRKEKVRICSDGDKYGVRWVNDDLIGKLIYKQYPDETHLNMARQQYWDNLSLNYYNYTYPYAREVARMADIANQTRVMCERMRQDAKFREGYLSNPGSALLPGVSAEKAAAAVKAVAARR